MINQVSEDLDISACLYYVPTLSSSMGLQHHLSGEGTQEVPISAFCWKWGQPSYDTELFRILSSWALRIT